MPLLEKEDLKLDYVWSTEPQKEPRSGGTTENVADPDKLQAGHGDRILPFLNEYARSRGLTEKNEALGLEKRIREKMGKKEMSEEELEQWLDRQREKK